MTANDLWKFTCACLKTPGVRSYHASRALWILWDSKASRNDSERNFAAVSGSFIYTFQLDTESKTLALFRTSLFQTSPFLSSILSTWDTFLKFSLVFTIILAMSDWQLTWVHHGFVCQARTCLHFANYEPWKVKIILFQNTAVTGVCPPFLRQGNDLLYIASLTALEGPKTKRVHQYKQCVCGGVCLYGMYGNIKEF